MEVIAERRLVAVFLDGGMVPVVLRVGRPYAHEKGGYACPIQSEGLRIWQGPNVIFGVDGWQALMLGLRFLRSIMTTEMERGAVFHREDGEQPIRIEELFALREVE